MTTFTYFCLFLALIVYFIVKKIKSKSTLNNIARCINEDPQNWKMGTYTFKHKSGLLLWVTGIPIFSIKIYESKMGENIRLSLIDRIEIWYSIRVWEKNIDQYLFKS